MTFVAQDYVVEGHLTDFDIQTILEYLKEAQTNKNTHASKSITTSPSFPKDKLFIKQFDGYNNMTNLPSYSRNFEKEFAINQQYQMLASYNCKTKAVPHSFSYKTNTGNTDKVNSASI